jgi:hypothetical protein
MPPELEAEMTPAVKAAFWALFDRIDKLESHRELKPPSPFFTKTERSNNLAG